MDNSNYIEFFVSSLLNIIRVMADMEGCQREALTQPPVYVSQGLIIVIGITGTKPGRVILDASMETSRRLSEAFNCSTNLKEEVVFNSMAELANMVAGHGISQIKNLKKHRDLMLTPPNIFFSNAINIASHKIRTVTAAIDTPAGLINISVGFEE